MKTKSGGPSRPVLRWHGGKWILAPWIIDHFPPHRVYTEAYGGAGSVLLRKPRSYAEIWNDLDEEAVNLFRVLRNKKQSAELRRALYLMPFSRVEFQRSYEPTDNPIEKALRLVIRSYMGFGANAHNKGQPTGFRANSNRAGTTPAHDWANYPGALALTIKRLRGVILEQRHGPDILLQHDGPDTLHYVDPPYVHGTRGSRNNDSRHRYAHEMFDTDHEDLSCILKNLKGMVVLSGYRGALYEKLYADWTSFERQAFADGAKQRVEVLWLNESASLRLTAGTRELWPKGKKVIPADAP